MSLPLASGSLPVTVASFLVLLLGYVVLFGLWWFVFRDPERRRQRREEQPPAPPGDHGRR